MTLKSSKIYLLPVIPKVFLLGAQTTENFDAHCDYCFNSVNQEYLSLRNWDLVTFSKYEKLISSSIYKSIFS